jgi:hypothetical protein
MSSRNRGALPRLRGRGEQGEIGSQCLARVVLYLAVIETEPRLGRVMLTSLGRYLNLASIDTVQSVNSGKASVTKSPCSPRPRKRGSAPGYQELIPTESLLLNKG